MNGESLLLVPIKKGAPKVRTVLAYDRTRGWYMRVVHIDRRDERHRRFGVP